MCLRSQSVRAGLRMPDKTGNRLNSGTSTSRVLLGIFSLTITAFLAIDLHACLGGSTSRKNPLPEAGAQAEAAKVAKELYGEEYAAAKTAPEKRRLAGKILAKTGEIENDLPGRYVLLRLSRDIATQAGDIDTAFLAVEQIDRFFDVNALDLKREVLVKSAALARTPAEHKAIVEKWLALFDQAVGIDDFRTASQLGPPALDACAKSGNQNLTRQVRQRIAEIEELARNYEKVKAAAALLDKAPDDPEANLTVGRYMSFVKRRWDEGLPMLALGKDPALKAVALKELDGAKTAQAQLELADQWRDLAEAQPAAVKKPMGERALFWYRKSLPALTGLMKSKAEMRIKELAPEEVASLIRHPSSGRPAETADADSGESPHGECRRWQIKGGDSPFDAELKQVERAMVVLKKKADDQDLTVAFDNLSDGDQEVVSDWTLRQADRIWGLGTAKIGPRESREAVRAKELARALDGACLRTVFSIDRTSSTESGKSGAKLELSGSWDSKLKKIVLPLPQAISAQISRDAKLAVMGRLNIKYTACLFCGGTGLAKCPKCSHGLVYHLESKPIVLPNGQRGTQNVRVSETCRQCNGTGRLGKCQHHELQAWEPFGTQKLPQSSFFTFTDSGGARRVCVALDEPRFQIYASGNVITLRRAEGRIDIQTNPAAKDP